MCRCRLLVADALRNRDALDDPEPRQRLGTHVLRHNQIRGGTCESASSSSGKASNCIHGDNVRISRHGIVRGRNSPYHGISRPRNGRNRAAIGFTSQGANRSSCRVKLWAKKIEPLSISSRPVRRIFAGPERLAQNEPVSNTMCGTLNEPRRH